MNAILLCDGAMRYDVACLCVTVSEFVYSAHQLYNNSGS